MPSLEELVKPRNEREEFLILSSKVIALHAAGGVLYSRFVSLQSGDGADAVEEARNEILGIADSYADRLRDLSWSQLQKENG